MYVLQLQGAVNSIYPSMLMGRNFCEDFLVKWDHHLYYIIIVDTMGPAFFVLISYEYLQRFNISSMVWFHEKCPEICCVAS